MSIQSVVILLAASATWAASPAAFAQTTPATNAPASVADHRDPAERAAVPAPAPPASPTVPTASTASSESQPLPEIENTPLGGRPPINGDVEPITGTGVGSWGLQTAMALGVVVMLVVLIRLGLKRLHGDVRTGNAGLVEVLARVPIAPKTCVLFLRIGERVIIAGQTQAGLNTLASFDDPDDVAEVLAHVQAAKPASITEGFSKLMKQFDRGYDPDRDDGTDRDEHVVDRARNDVTGLLTRIRSLNQRDEEK